MPLDFSLLFTLVAGSGCYDSMSMYKTSITGNEDQSQVIIGNHIHSQIVLHTYIHIPQTIIQFITTIMLNK